MTSTFIDCFSITRDRAIRHHPNLHTNSQQTLGSERKSLIHVVSAVIRAALSLMPLVPADACAWADTKVPDLIRSAEAFEKAGDYLSAIRVAEEATDSADQLLEEFSDDKIVAYLLLSRLCISTGDYERAKAVCLKSVSFFERAPRYGKSHPSLSVPLINLANAYDKLGDISRAEEAARRALSLNEQSQEIVPFLKNAY